MTDVPCVLAHDIGTSGIKSSIIDSNVTVLASVTSPYATLSLDNGWIEQDPELWWEGVVRNTQALSEQNPTAVGQVEAIGISGHMLGCVPVDGSGVPLAHSPIHADSRAVAQFETILDKIGREGVYTITGNILDPKSSLCKVLWFKEHERAIYDRTARFIQCKDFIVSRLTGNIDTTDLSDASHAGLLDIHKNMYADNMLRDLGIDLGKLPALHKGTDVVGTLNAETALLLGLRSGIPVVAGAGDGACANAGAGIAEPGDTYCNLGTTGWIATLFPKPFIDEQMRIFNITSIDGETTGVFGTMQTAGKAIDWIIDVLAVENAAQLDAIIEKTTTGSDGLVFLPYLEGERSPIFDPHARGVFFGLESSHESRHLARAVMEGVTFGLRSIYDAFKDYLEISELSVIGGGAKSRVWRQMIADVLHVDVLVHRTKSENATSIGAALAAAVGVGIFGSLKDAVRHIETHVSEHAEQDFEDHYKRNYGVYQSLYPVLKDLFKSNSMKL